MKIGGRIPWSVTALCETNKISCLVGRHLVGSGPECHLGEPIVPLGAVVGRGVDRRRSGSENINLSPGQPRLSRRTRKSSRKIRRVFFNPITRFIAV